MKKVEFKEKVMKGENQTITIAAEEKDPALAASLTLNGTRGRATLNGTKLQYILRSYQDRRLNPLNTMLSHYIS